MRITYVAQIVLVAGIGMGIMALASYQGYEKGKANVKTYTFGSLLNFKVEYPFCWRHKEIPCLWQLCG